MKNIQKLIIAVAIPLLVGVLGSLFTSLSVNNWYQQLVKPSFNPPNWVFSPVWTTLFIIIGLSFYLVWERDFNNRKNPAIGIYGLQLFLNFLWSVLFFGLKNPLLAFIEIIILWIAIALNIIVFYKIRREAGLLLIPYLLWVSFAAFLNYHVFILNYKL